MRKLLRQIDIEELYDFLEERLEHDESFSKTFLERFAAPDYDSAITSLVKGIDDAIDNAKIEMMDVEINLYKVNDEIMSYAKKGHIRLAFSALEIMLRELVRFYEENSELDIPCEIFGCVNLMQDVANEAKNPKDKDFLFANSLRLAKEEIDSTGILDYQIELWDLCAQLVTEENRAKLEQEADNMPLYSYIEAIRKLDGQQGVDDYIQAHLDEEGIPDLAFSEAMAKKNYSEAENLLSAFLEKENGFNKFDALEKLYSIHEQTGNTSKMIETAKKLLALGATLYYHKLKALLQATGEWEEQQKTVDDMFKISCWLNGHYGDLKI
ncbi:MAG: hypothetical protein LBT59_07255 [Clostridiales bacterium]|jgi:hypothetical protein|nr:hypothetical protein [Clostridiales bacterium]